MSDRIPTEVFPPGEFLAEELDARGWTQEDLARILGKPLPTINKIINGKVGITANTATKLAASIGNSALFWMNLEASWQLHKSGGDASDVRERAQIYSSAPVREMARRKWIMKTNSTNELAAELCKHFGVDDLSMVPQMSAAARSASRGENGELSPAKWAWMCRCRNVSSLVDAKRYIKAELESCIPDLLALTAEPEDARHVAKILSEVGVRTVVVEHLTGTRLDGGKLHRNETEPVVGLSLRYGRLDNFWFTLMHEIAHILNNDGVTADSDMYCQGEDVDRQEERANRMAAEWLIPRERFESFIRRTSPVYTARKIVNFSSRLNVHPSIVVGQLKFRGEIEQNRFNRMSVDIRDIVRQSMISDGWGEQAPLP